jgi:hypothetical protein
MNYALRFKPSRQYIENLKAGDLALNPYGQLSKVLKITYRGDTIQIGRHEGGKAYVGVELENGEYSTITSSYKEGELVRTLALSAQFTSPQCDEIEAKRPEDDYLPIGINNDYEALLGKKYW